MSQSSLFASERLTLNGALEKTAESLRTHGAAYRHWCLAYSGGKDSTATLTAVAWLIDRGRVERPESLTVAYADTRMELPPLHANALETLEVFQRLGWNTVHALPDMDHRFFVYMFGTACRRRAIPSAGVRSS